MVCFPFNCIDKNIDAGTNLRIVGTYNRALLFLLHAMSKIEELADKVERLLLRHEEALRTKTLLEQQVSALVQERDALRSRLNMARTRIDTLIEQLPRSHDHIDDHETN